MLKKTISDNSVNDDLVIEKIKKTLLRLHGAFAESDNAVSRQDYMKSIGREGIDGHFSLSADDIIKNKIGARVIGCTGTAKLFAKLAEEQNLDVFVVTTAEFDTWNKARQGGDNIINGHQIIAVRTKDGLRAFDPGKTTVQFIPAHLKVGNFIKALDKQPPYLITGIIPAKEFEKVDSYAKLRNLYASSDRSVSDFTISPNRADYAARVGKGTGERGS